MKYYYSFYKRSGLYYPVVYHYSNIDEGRVNDYTGKIESGHDNSSDAYDDARKWAEDNLPDSDGIEMGD